MPHDGVEFDEQVEINLSKSKGKGVDIFERQCKIN